MNSNHLENTDPKLRRKDLIFSIIFSIFLLIISLVINFYAGDYASDHASNSVTDIVLSNIPVYNVGWFFTYGAIIFWVFTIYLSIKNIYRIPFIAKSISLFIVIRASFVSMTHIAPFPNEILIHPSYILSKFTFGSDLFFSGHTGLPFLMALIFWNQKPLRYFFIGASILFACVVLLGHLHYTIDVFAAYFITYSIYHLTERLFKKDLKLGMF